MAEKIFYSMGEVAEMFDVKTSLIRHWEAQFDAVKPTRNKKGNRLFSQQDVEHLKVIYHLVKERGMTLEGAKRAMKRRAAGGGEEIRREAELMARLKHIRALLLEVREDLKTEGKGIVIDEAAAPEEREEVFEERVEPFEKPVEPAAEPLREEEPLREAEPPRVPEPLREEGPLTEEKPLREAAAEMPEEEREADLPAAGGWDAGDSWAAEAEPEMPEEEEPWDSEVPAEEPLTEEEPMRENMAEAEPWDSEVPEKAAAEEEPQETEPAEMAEAPAAEMPEQAPAQEEPAAGPQPRVGRRTRRKGDDDDKELFAFYEQSLF